MLGDTAVSGALLLIGPPGSGKTTRLRSRHVALVRGGERGILFLVQSRRAARALTDDIARELGVSSDQIRVSTWHAYALALLRTHYRRLGYSKEPSLLTAPDQFALVREMLTAREEEAHWGARARPLLRLAGFVEELREFVLRAQDALESPEHLVERARLARREDLAEAGRFFRRYLDTIDAQSLVDHANVIALAVSLLEDHPDVAAEVRAETRHLLVDDYQDVTPAQETLLRLLVVPEGSVAVAASEEGRIYGFRGASDSAIGVYRRVFGPREESLDRAHRLPKAEAWLFEHLTDEAEAIARSCLRAHMREGVPWRRIAVLFRRYGAASRAVRRALERLGVPYVVVGENRPLVREPALVPMLELVRAALRVDERMELLPRVLSSPVVGLDPYDVRSLQREARLRETSLDGLVAAPPADLPGTLTGRLVEVRGLLEQVADLDAKGGRPDALFWFLWNRLDYFREMVDRGDDAELDAVVAFARAIERFSDRRPGSTFDDYLEALEGVDFGPEPWNMPEERRPEAIRLLTAHQASGQEFDVVFVAGAVEGELPDVRDVHPMLDVRDLLAPATAVERRRERLAEERRLFTVATTRALTQLVVTAARRTSQGDALAPTPFVEALGLSWSPAPADFEPLTRDDAEALWRRRLRDQSLPDADRLDALDALARLPGVDPETWWYEREWTDPGRPLVGPEFRTSYSRLGPYENCGLQYLYQVELGLDPEQTHSMLVGNWIHDIVDRCAKGEIAAAEGDLLAELQRIWNPAIFPSPAIEHRYRVECTKMLQRWLAADGMKKPLATEVRFEFPIDGVLLRGYIDRVVRCGTKSVRLTDYKTGSSPKSDREIADDLQLATYYLACKRDPNLATLGDPMLLELAFLAVDDFRYGGPRRPGFDPRKVQDYEQQAEERLLELINGIRKEEFAPRAEASCHWCKFKTLCPVWPEGDEVRL